MDIYSFKGLAAMTQLDSSFKEPKHANKDCKAESLFPLLSDVIWHSTSKYIISYASGFQLHHNLSGHISSGLQLTFELGEGRGKQPVFSE